MNQNEMGKVAAAVVIAAVGVVAVNVVGDALVRPQREQKLAVTLPEKSAEQPAKEEKQEKIQPIAPLLASASVEQGKKVARKCHACHNLKKGAGKKIGPDLWNVVMRDKGSNPGFSYSSAMQEAKGKWTYEELNKFVHAPRDYIPGTKMTFAGLKDSKDRAAVIAYLRTLSDNPAPLPKTGS